MSLVYCDFIADTIKNSLVDVMNETAPAVRLTAIGRIASDLHPTEGYFMSPTKRIEVVDANGTRYTVTVEVKD